MTGRAPDSAASWAASYAAAARLLPLQAAAAQLTLAGFCTCIDHTLDLHELAPALLADTDRQAVALGMELRRRAAAGIGGELCMDWPQGPDWFARRGPGFTSLGGTAAQAANTLAMLGAPVLLAVQDRHPAQLRLIAPAVLLATSCGPLPAGSVGPAARPGKLPHVIFEYRRGEDVAGVTPPRSTRVITRFGDDDMDEDPQFAALSAAMARSAGAGILAGFNAIPPARLDRRLGEMRGVAEAWHASGLALIHLELGDFPDPRTREATLTALRGRISSVGMNANELAALLPGEEAVDRKALALAARLEVSRISIHADGWALSLTRHEAELEQQALIAGCLLAATRAASGRLTVPHGAPAGAQYCSPPGASMKLPTGWRLASCASPYLPQPRSTLGLGDTFLAGTLLVLGQSRAASARTPSTTATRGRHDISLPPA